MLNKEPSSSRTVPSRVPAHRSMTDEAGEDFDGLGHVLALGYLIHLLIRNPAQAVRRDLMSKFTKRRCRLGVS